MGDLRGQIKDLQEGMQGSIIHTMSHKEFMTLQDKVLSVLTRLESRVDALTRHVKARDEKMRHKLAICKVTISAQVIATNEGLEDSHTTSGGKEVSPSTAMYEKAYTMEDKGKQQESTPRMRCFICDGPHLARECPKKEALNALIKKNEKEDEDALGKFAGLNRRFETEVSTRSSMPWVGESVTGSFSKPPPS